MLDKLCIGVVGTSWWADMLHLPSLENYPRTELKAICGRNRERTQEMANKYGIPNVFTDYGEMIDRGDLDALLILTPDDSHYEITMRALDARLHVMCEKPLALNASDAHMMYEQAERAGVKHGVFYTQRWLAPELYVAELLRAGFIGKPFHCDLRFLGDYAFSREYQWRFDQKRANGVLADLGSHMIDLARWYFGEIEQVSCQLATFVERASAYDSPLVPANDSANLLVQFENGAQGTFYVSGVTHVAERRIQYQYTFHGEAGTLEAELSLAGTEIRAARRDETEFHVYPIPGRLWDKCNPRERFDAFNENAAGVRAFIDAILEDQTFAPNFYDGWKAQQVIDAALESARTKRWVAVGKQFSV